MITNPNTLGLFESNIKEIAELVHARGGLVYGDGANLNAIMGLCHMGHIGIDVMHMNLHKTFSTPHRRRRPRLRRDLREQDACAVPARPPSGRNRRQARLGGQLRRRRRQSIGRMHPFWGQFGVVLRA